MKSVVLAIMAYAGFTAAWMPHDGHNEAKRWLPSSLPIRGVNLGSQFIVEPWMANDEWNSMGCGGTASEFDCVSKLGQAQANTSWANHWSTWTTEDDISLMQSYGLNAIRIPVGYWIREDLVYSNSEYFPQGGLYYLEQICGWASDAGFYIIIDLHGAPGAQTAENADTGQYASSPGFYVDYQYERAYQFLEWMANIIHTNSNYRNVGTLEVVNEPIGQVNSQTDYMIQTYYPTAWSRIRAAEAALNVSPNNLLHIQMMDAKWGSGDPEQFLTDDTFAAYDDHRYLKYDPTVGLSPSDYLDASCYDDRGGNSPTIVGEFSLSVNDTVGWNDPDFYPPDSNVAWYGQWFAAQIIAYEKQDGWIFWSWKANYINGINDWRWSYEAAVTAGAIPQNLNDAINSNPCAGI